MVELSEIQIGSSLAVVLPEVVTTRLNATEGDSLFLVQEEAGYHLTAFDPELTHQVELADEISNLYRNTLTNLP